MISWVKRAAEELVKLRAVGTYQPEGPFGLQGTGPGWSYRPGEEPFTEPTALATLALRAIADPPQAARLAEAGQWLSTIQKSDGSVGLSGSLPDPPWATPLASLAWAALGGFAKERQRAADFLVGFTAKRFNIVGSTPEPDTPEWPWVADTYAWAEPTAMAILALRREGRGSHERVQNGISFLRERAVPSGGWNYGNPTSFERELRPLPGPTGLALLALSGAVGREPMVDRALEFLDARIAAVRAPESLSWALLGMAAWNARPAKADAWLGESFRHLRAGGCRTIQLSSLLVAAPADGCQVFLNHG